MKKIPDYSTCSLPVSVGLRGRTGYPDKVE